MFCTNCAKEIFSHRGYLSFLVRKTFYQQWKKSFVLTVIQSLMFLAELSSSYNADISVLGSKL